MTDVNIIQGNKLKVDDTSPNLRVQLLDDNGAVENVSGFTGTLTVKRSDADTPVVDDASITLHDASSGVVEYDWSPSETTAAGVYDAEITMTDGTETTTYPNDSFFRVDIMEDL